VHDAVEREFLIDLDDHDFITDMETMISKLKNNPAAQ